MDKNTDILNFPMSALVKIDGGLGSQMWQYALGVAVEHHSPLRALHDLSWYYFHGKDINNKCNRLFILDKVFKNVRLRLPKEDLRQRFILNLDNYPGSYRKFDPSIIARKTPVYLGGYYPNAKYIVSVADTIRNIYNFTVALSERNKKLLADIMTTTAPVAVHVRRGDYVGSRHDVVGPGFFLQALNWISCHLAPVTPTFFVFSNGMEWAKEHLSSAPYNFVYVDNNDNDSGQVDMFLMAQCKHFIISNSSMSWWAAWLSSRSANKVVIMPDKWVADEKPDEKYSMRVDGWQVLPAI